MTAYNCPAIDHVCEGVDDSVFVFGVVTEAWFDLVLGCFVFKIGYDLQF